MVKVGKKINNELQKQKNLVVQVDTDGWQETFLYLTLGSVAFINVNLSSIEFIYSKLSLHSLLTILAGVKPQT